MDVKVPRLGSLPTATQDDGALAESWRKWGEILPKLFAERLGLIVYAFNLLKEFEDHMYIYCNT